MAFVADNQVQLLCVAQDIDVPVVLMVAAELMRIKLVWALSLSLSQGLAPQGLCVGDDE